MAVIPCMKHKYLCVECKMCGEPVELSHDIDEIDYNEDNEVICKAYKYILTTTEPVI